MVAKLRWSEKKSAALRADETRGGIGFEECLIAIERGDILEILPNPSASYPAQRMYVLKINDYAYCVPFVEDENVRFLKTLFPSRKHTNQYLRGKKNG